MITRDKILKDLAVQEKHEGKTENIRIIRLFLADITTSSQWHAFIAVRWHRYGILSYQCHRFYDATAPLHKWYGSKQGDGSCASVSPG